MKQAQQQKEPQQAAPAAAPQQQEHSPEQNELIRPNPTPELNPRNRALAEIAQRANQAADEAAQESVPSVDDDEIQSDERETETPQEAAPAEDGAPAEEAGKPDQAPAADQAPGASAQPGIDPNAEYEIVVDGLPVKLKGAQIIARAQKHEAADIRMREASKLLEEARRASATGRLPGQGVAPQQQAPERPVVLDEAQLAQMIQYGSPEQAASAVAQLRQQRPDTVTQEGLQSFMAQQLPRIVEMQLMFREGKAFAEREYGDLLADPYLKQMFFWREDQLRKAGDTRAHVELYKDIGEDLRKRFNRSVPAASTQKTQQLAPTREQRQQAKASAPAAPRLASARLEGAAAAQKPKTREDIIAEMRKARGQHALGVR